MRATSTASSRRSIACPIARRSTRCTTPAVMDIKGDGRQKASAYWGRYYDPIRMDMTNFAGTTSGSTREEQVYINNQWLTYRVRGFSPIPDGVFAPATKTPYTDELQLHYERDLRT